MNEDKDKQQAQMWWVQLISSFIAAVIAVSIGMLVWVLWDLLGLP